MPHKAAPNEIDLSEIARPANVPIRTTNEFSEPPEEEPILRKNFNWQSGDLGTTKLTPLTATTPTIDVQPSGAMAEPIATDWIPDTLYIHAASKHLGGSGTYSHNGQVQDFNETNSGFALGWDISENGEIRAGGYKNSYNDTTFYVGYAHTFLEENLFNESFTVKAGVLAGVTHGYAEYAGTGISVFDDFADQTGISPIAALEASLCHNDTGVCAVLNAMPMSVNSDPYNVYDAHGNEHTIEAPKGVVALSFSVPL